MAFCVNCGSKNDDGAKFCCSCGKTVTTLGQSRTVTVGQVKKCPSCGAAVESFTGRCPECGHELSAGTVDSYKDFVKKLDSTSPYQKPDVIKQYPIPNNREDLLEFAIYAYSNLNEFIRNPTASQFEDDEITNAWVTKMDQVQIKAEFVFSDDQSKLNKIIEFNKKVIAAKEKNVKHFNSSKSRDATLSVIGKILYPLKWYVLSLFGQNGKAACIGMWFLTLTAISLMIPWLIDIGVINIVPLTPNLP